jgi:tetratricopeptide (TPR) repeat protein
VRATFAAAMFLRIAAAQTPGERSEIVARNNRAVALASEGRQAEAEEQYRAALADSDDDLTRAKIASNLAELLRRQDRYREAEQLYRSALEWRQRNLPAGDIDVEYSLNNLGEVYRVEGREWEARNLIGTAARGLQELHPEAAGLPIVLGNFAVLLCRSGEFDRAEELLRSAVLVYQKRHETRSRDYALTLANLGQVLETKNELESAGQVYDEAIGIFENVGAPAGAELAAVLANQGALLARMNRPEQARQSEERALQLLHPVGDAVLRAQILRNLGNIVAGGGKPADSVPYFEQSLVIQEKTLGAEHPATVRLLLDYASATQRAGNKSLARKLRKRAEDLLARISRQSLSQMTVSLRDMRDSK